MTHPRAPTRSELDRRMLWLVPAGCLAFVLVCGGAVGAVLWGITGLMRSSDAYSDAVAAAAVHPDVIASLGEPVEVGILMTGSMSVSGPTGEANLGVPLTGPRGEGRLFVVAEKVAGRWTFSVLEVEINGSAERIDLLGSVSPST